MSKKYNDKNGIFPMINTVVWTIFYKIYWDETSNINTNFKDQKTQTQTHGKIQMLKPKLEVLRRTWLLLQSWKPNDFFSF